MPATDKTGDTRQKFADRRAAQERAAALASRRRRNRFLGLGSIVMAVVVVAVLVAVWVGGGGRSTAASEASPAGGTPIAAAITSKLASVPLSSPVNAPGSRIVAAPEAISDAKLTADGKSDLLYIGAEFCPICAAERWAMYVALSKFGTFSSLPAQWRRGDDLIRRVRMAWAVVGLGTVVYLLYTELLRIDAICLWCTSVHVLTFVVFISTVLGTLCIVDDTGEPDDTGELDDTGEPDPLLAR